MPHISKKFLQKDNFSKIQKQLYKVTNDLVRSGESKLFFDEILTKTEKIMLSKRLAMIIMLNEGESPYAIENMLKVSPSTVYRISLSYEKGKYSGVLKEVKEQSSFWVEFHKLIPPRVGRNRFKNFLKF